MRQVGRWYDADISFEVDVSGHDFTGQFLQNSSIEQLLRKFEVTGGVHFKVGRKKIVVTP